MFLANSRNHSLDVKIPVDEKDLAFNKLEVSRFAIFDLPLSVFYFLKQDVKASDV